LRALLDTHTLFWWLTDDPRLSLEARRAIETEAEGVHVSVATAWEIAIKIGAGKWPEAADLIDNFEALGPSSPRSRSARPLRPG
jgi:PIN domain nuclease of toxin-antitoxin system